MTVSSDNWPQLPTRRRKEPRMIDPTRPLTIKQDPHCPEWHALRRRVMEPRLNLPKPMGDRGKLGPDEMRVRVEAHHNLRAALERLAACEQEAA